MSEFVWIDLGDGRSAYRKIEERRVQRSALPAPMFIRDTMEPVQSMADGKMYTSKKAIRDTYKPGGNPQGVRYTEIGSDPAWKRMDRPQPNVDPKAVETALEKAFARYDRGEVPSNLG